MVQVIEQFDGAVAQSLVEKALRAAAAIAIPNLLGGQLHKARAAAFVTCLAGELRALHGADDVRVFDRSCADNFAFARSREVLYDVSVLRMGVVPNTPYPYVREALGLVESELSRNPRDILHDLGKLRIGAAPIKLFVGSFERRRRPNWDLVRAAGEGCVGRLFVAFIPHPCEWPTEQDVRCEEILAQHQHRIAESGSRLVGGEAHVCR